MAPPPHGSSLHRSRACSRPLPRDSSRSPTYHRPHVSIAASVPRGVGCLGNPTPCRLRLTPAHPRGSGHLSLALGIEDQSLPQRLRCQPDTWAAGMTPARRYRDQRSTDLSPLSSTVSVGRSFRGTDRTCSMLLGTQAAAPPHTTKELWHRAILFNRLRHSSLGDHLLSTGLWHSAGRGLGWNPSGHPVLGGDPRWAPRGIGQDLRPLACPGLPSRAALAYRDGDPLWRSSPEMRTTLFPT